MKGKYQTTPARFKCRQHGVLTEKEVQLKRNYKGLHSYCKLCGGKCERLKNRSKARGTPNRTTNLLKTERALKAEAIALNTTKDTNTDSKQAGE